MLLYHFVTLFSDYLIGRFFTNDQVKTESNPAMPRKRIDTEPTSLDCMTKNIDDWSLTPIVARVVVSFENLRDIKCKNKKADEL